MIAARIISVLWMLNIGNARNGHIMVVTAPRIYTGLRPIRSVKQPTRGIMSTCRMCAKTRSVRIRVVFTPMWSRYVIDKVTPISRSEERRVGKDVEGRGEHGGC